VSDDRLLGCVLPRGTGIPLLARLAQEKGITRAEVHSGRGFMGSDPRGLFNRVEKDVMSVIVEGERADEIFAWLYHEAGIADMEGRFLYMTRLRRATPFALPDGVPAERPST
jgi:hypothetical protein